MDTSQEELAPGERAEFTEFKRKQREAELRLVLKRLIADASRRETDRPRLKKLCGLAKKYGLCGVLVSPVNVAAARKLLAGSGVRVVCAVGGNGETLPAVKKYEAKRAVKAGAEELRLTPCASALLGGSLSFLKKEIAKVARAAKGRTVTLSLDDRAFGEEDVALGTKAAVMGGADGVCVRGETALLIRAADVGAGKLALECSGVENAEQLRSLRELGSARLVSPCCEALADDLFSRLS